MLRPAPVDDSALGLVQWKNAGSAPERIPDLLDEREPFPDGQSFDVDGGIYHARKSVFCGE